MLLKRSELFIFLLRCLKIKCLTLDLQELFILFTAVTKKRNEGNENTDYLIQTPIKKKVRDLSRIKQF